MTLTQRLTDWRDHAAFRVLRFFDRKRRTTPLRLATRRCSVFPAQDVVRGPTLYITGVGRLRKWASFRCPGDCGKVVRLRLASSESPHWSAATDWLGRATISPSVRQLNDCGCHFWVRRGCVRWCPDTPPSRLPPSETPHWNASRTIEGEL